MKRLISYIMLFVISYSTISGVVNYVIAEKVLDMKIIQENFSNKNAKDHKSGKNSLIFSDKSSEKKNDFTKKGISFKKNKIKKCITPYTNFFDIQLFASSEFFPLPVTISSAFLEKDLPPPRLS